MKNREEVVAQVGDADTEEEVQELLEEAWQEARLGALNYEQLLFALQVEDDIDYEDVKDMLETGQFSQDNYEAQHK